MRPTPPRRLLRLPVLALLLLLGACGAMGVPDTPPKVRLVGLAPGGGGLFEQALFLDLRITNPNRQDLRFDGLTFNLAVNDQPLADGVSNQSVTVPGLGEETLRVKANASTLQLARQLFRLPDNQTFRYALDGEVYVAGAALDYTLPYESEGEVDLMRDILPRDTAPAR